MNALLVPVASAAANPDPAGEVAGGERDAEEDQDRAATSQIPTWKPCVSKPSQPGSTVR